MPIEAIREALVNAFTHRDYSFRGGAVSIAVFSDRLEIWSDGLLPYGVTIDDLSRRHISKPRNDLIAKVMYRRDMFEEWGRGTLKMIELCEKASIPTPQFFETSGSVCVEFYFEAVTQTEVPEDISPRLSEGEQAVIEVLQNHESLSLKEISGKLKKPINERLIRYYLSKLKDKGLVDTRGHGRGSVWFLVK